MSEQASESQPVTDTIDPADREEIARLALRMHVPADYLAPFVEATLKLADAGSMAVIEAADVVRKALPTVLPPRWVLPDGSLDDEALLAVAAASSGRLWVIPEPSEPSTADTEIASLEHAVIESALALHHVAGAPADTVYQASRTLYRNTIALAEALKESPDDDRR